jgi:hypothetical protein
MERSDKIRCISVLFWQISIGRFCSYSRTSTVSSAVIISWICPMLIIWERWPGLFSCAKDRRGSGPTQEMPLQRSRVVSRIEGVPTASLKGADTNINSLKRDSGNWSSGQPGLHNRKRSVVIFVVAQGGSPKEEDRRTENAQTVRRGDGGSARDRGNFGFSCWR